MAFLTRGHLHDQIESVLMVLSRRVGPHQGCLEFGVILLILNPDSFLLVRIELRRPAPEREHGVCDKRPAVGGLLTRPNPSEMLGKALLREAFPAL